VDAIAKVDAIANVEFFDFSNAKLLELNIELTEFRFSQEFKN